MARTSKTTKKSVGAMKQTLTFDNLLTQQYEAPAWILDMHRYYAEHGFYRGADVRRVLGGPVAHTEGCAILNVIGNGKTQPSR